jgi:hypothetical protein
MGAETSLKNLWKPNYATTSEASYNSFNNYLDGIDKRLGYNVCSPAWGTSGAQGDDSTDDSTAIQACIDAAVAAGKGRVFLPEGIYRIYSQLTITSDYIILEGEGHGTVIESYLTTGVPAILIDNSEANMYGVKLLNFKINGGRDNGSGQEGELIRMVNVVGGIMSGLYVSNSNGMGIKFHRAQECLVTDSEIRGNASWGIFQGQISDGSTGQGFTVRTNVIQNNGVTYAGSGGVRIDGAEALVTDNTIAGHSNHLTDVGVYVVSADRCKIFGNRQFENNKRNVWLGTKYSLSGATTSGSAIITGMTDTSQVFVGDPAEPSAGFTSSEIVVLSKTDTTVTVDEDATSTQGAITLDIDLTVDNNDVSHNSIGCSNTKVINGQATVSFSASGNFIKDSAGGFNTANAEAGDYIVIEGSTSNDGAQKIDSFNANYIYVDTTNSPPESLITEAAGQSVTIYAADVSIAFANGQGNYFQGNHMRYRGQVVLLGDDNNGDNYYYDNTSTAGLFWTAKIDSGYTEGKLAVRGMNKGDYRYATFIDGDTTPSVLLGLPAYYFDNSTATSVTEFDFLHNGQTFLLYDKNANTTLVNGALLKPWSGGNELLGTSQVYLVTALPQEASSKKPIAYVFRQN